MSKNKKWERNYRIKRETGYVRAHTRHACNKDSESTAESHTCMARHAVVQMSRRYTNAICQQKAPNIKGRLSQNKKEQLVLDNQLPGLPDTGIWSSSNQLISVRQRNLCKSPLPRVIYLVDVQLTST